MSLGDGSWSRFVLGACAIVLLAHGVPARATTIDFEEFGGPPHSLGPASYYNGADGAGGFVSHGASFNNTFTDFGWGTFWTGWAVSNTTDTTTPGLDNQFSAFPGGGAAGSTFYGVASVSAYDPLPAIGLPIGAVAQSLRVANTTYAALSMLEGDPFAKKFGGATGSDPDWFKLVITGLDGTGASIGQIEFYLADYRFADNALDYVLNTWTTVDLTNLSMAQALTFNLDSSDVGPWGMNTPAYFAVDDLVFVPEPASALILLAGVSVALSKAPTGRRSVAGGVSARKQTAPPRSSSGATQSETPFGAARFLSPLRGFGDAAPCGPGAYAPGYQLPPLRGWTSHVRRLRRSHWRAFLPLPLSLLAGLAVTSGVIADSPFATRVIDYRPAPGQLVNDPLFNDPAKALGRPYAGGYSDPGNSSLVTLGGFGGSLTLAFDHTVRDDPANPFGLDAIVYGNAFWVSGNPNRKWAECGVIEISRDVNGNGLADDPWYLIPGSHITNPASQYQVQGWDDNIGDPTYPPNDETWIPPGRTGFWTTAGYRLPPATFETIPLVNPNGVNATQEGIWGYADLSPTLRLGDLNGDNVVEDPNTPPEIFYTRPDNPFKVGLTPGCGGGDAFDIAWAIDAVTGVPAYLDGFDFIRISTGENHVDPILGELSTEVDAVADVAEGRFGDAENDGDIDLDDFAILSGCLTGPGQAAPTSPCRVMDFDQDGDVDLRDMAEFQRAFTGP